MTDLDEWMKSSAYLYADLVAELSAVDPRLVATCQFREAAEQRAAQQSRNLRANGIH